MLTKTNVLSTQNESRLGYDVHKFSETMLNLNRKKTEGILWSSGMFKSLGIDGECMTKFGLLNTDSCPGKPSRTSMMKEASIHYYSCILLKEIIWNITITKLSYETSGEGGLTLERTRGLPSTCTDRCS